MKNYFIKYLSAGLLLLLATCGSVYAANTYTIVYTSQPTSPASFVGSTLVLEYVVQSTVPQIIPMPARYMSFTPSNSAVFTTQSITDSCDDEIPANGTCSITVTLAKGSSGAGSSATGQLKAYWSNSLIEIQNSAVITVNGAPAPLTFAQQPTSPKSVTVSSSRELLYRVTNPNSSAVTLTSSTYTSSALFSPTTPPITVSGTGCSASSIAANTTCNFIVTVTAGASTGSATNQALTVNYTDGGSPAALTSDDITINVAALQALSFTDQPTSTTVGTDSSLNLFYSVMNPNSSAAALTSLAYTSSALFTPNTPPISSTTPGCESLTSIPGNTTCIYQVSITTGGTNGTAANQALTVTPTVGSPISSNDISITLSNLLSVLLVKYPPTPQNMPPSNSQTLLYTITNPSGSPVAFTASITGATAAVTTVLSNDCSSTVPANGTCDLLVRLNSQTISTDPTPESLTLTIASGLTEAIDFNIGNNTTRTITFVNQCNYQVWFGVNTANVFNLTGGTTCTTPGVQSNCPNGATCQVVNSSLNQCYWNAPAPVDGNYQLNPFGQAHSTNTVSVPITSDFANANLKGNIMNFAVAGRTGCSTTQTCTTGDCTGNSAGTTGINSTGACTPTKGFLQPATQGELNFFTGNQGGVFVDSFDGEIINGATVPLSITPSAAPGGSNGNPYTCGVAGGAQPYPSLGLGNCPWTFNLSNLGSNAPYFVWVSDGGATCATSATCGGLTCGLSSASVAAGGNPPPLTCGNFKGYWSADQVCGVNSSIGTPFNCSNNSGLSGSFSGTTLTNLYACTGTIPSCYTSGSVNDQCCGCQNWQSSPTNLTIPSNPAFVQQCDPPSSTSWKSNVLPSIRNFKAACPSLYTYPFDDKSSSFTCSQYNNAGVNATNYTVTFCPQGATGAP